MNKKPRDWKKINQGYRCFRCGCDLRKEKSMFMFSYFAESLFGSWKQEEIRFICARCRKPARQRGLVSPVSNK